MWLRRRESPSQSAAKPRREEARPKGASNDIDDRRRNGERSEEWRRRESKPRPCSREKMG